MAGKVNPIPEGMHTLTPHLVVKGASEAIDFYKKAFGAVENSRHHGPDGKKIMHAQLRIGNSLLFLVDEFPEFGCSSPLALNGSPVTIHLQVEDADKVFNQAVAAGAKPTMPLQNQFWGDRYGQIKDPFGHTWSIGTHIEDVSPEELAARAKSAFPK